MAVRRRGETEVRTIKVSDDFAPGLAGVMERFRSLVGGLAITAGNAFTPVHTVRYPYEKLSVSPRWRGALRLRGTLGVDDITEIRAASPAYNALIEALYDAKRLPPCAGNCPANVDARGQSFHVADGRPYEAYELVRERNVFPGVLGRICHHPCETSCRRNYYDEPVAIRPLHRYVQECYDEVRADRVKPLPVTREQTVAILGSGPSGLAAAYDLMKLGYAVTCYEKNDKPGGALYSGVPAYRLPREVLHGEIDDLVTMGLDLKCGIEIGPDVPLDHLVGEFDAVLIATGLQQSRKLPIPGNDADGVQGALEFLADGNWKGDAGVKGKRVFVIGGGNVAVDVARVALRVGAKEVHLGCLESRDEMPCHPWEIEEAIDEGVIAMCGQGPEAVLEHNGKVVGMRLRSCLSVFDASGRFAPQFGDDYSEVPCDAVVFSIGQGSRLGAVVAGTDLMLDERGNLMVDGSLFTTGVAGVFACGEVVTGPGAAIGSIATGHEAADSIHRYLEGRSLTEGRVPRPVPLYDTYAPATLEGVEDSRRRAEVPLTAPDERVKDFRAVEQGLTTMESLAEAARCLRCQSGVCVGCTFCARTCPDYALQVERVDDPGARCLTRYELDLTKCCFCGLCAEQCPTDALTHTGQYELSFYHRDLMLFDRAEMRRDATGTRATGADGRDAAAGPEEGTACERARGREGTSV
jgi:NADPH-dependent glutamate synthase beta subunit-like oxidoreductase/formate hydrogenlyase subunit 6/NADH:ubiquinone oxidoreductase subunit I